MNTELETFLSLSIDKVNKNVEIISKDQLGQDYMLHISPDNMHNKAYVPWIGYRQAKSEDRTIPRITVAPTLLGCYVGYSNLFNNFFSYYPDNNDSYKQGLYIHEIEFDTALKPNTKLVYDQKRSDEHWLVTYNQDTKKYKGRLIGKLFLQSINATSVGKKPVVCTAIMYVEVRKKEGIRLSKNIFLNQGYWIINGILDEDNTSWENDRVLTVSEISQSEFNSVKQQSAAMLSIECVKPPFAMW